MRKPYPYLAGLLLITGSLQAATFEISNAAAAQDQTQVQTPASNPNTVYISADHPQFLVQLPSNPTTGYQWYLTEYDARLIQPTGFRYQTDNTRLVGAPGLAIFSFKATDVAFAAPHATTINFAYSRPWENAPGEQKVIYVTTSAKG